MLSVYSALGYFVFLFDLYLIWLILTTFANILQRTELMMGKRTYWEHISWALPFLVAVPITSIYYYFILGRPFGSIEFFNVIIFFLVSATLFTLFFFASVHRGYFDIKIIFVYIIYLTGSLFYSAEAPYTTRLGNALFTIGAISIGGCLFIISGYAREFKVKRSIWSGFMISSLIFPLGGVFNSFAQNVLLEGARESFLVLLNIAFFIFLVASLIAFYSILKFKEEVIKFEYEIRKEHESELKVPAKFAKSMKRK